MKRHLLSALAAFFCLSSIGHTAPGVDFSISVGQWQPDYSGEIGQNDNDATLNQLGFDDDKHSIITMVLKHSVPILPNIKIQKTDLTTDASGDVTSFTLDDFTFVAGTESELDLSHTDITLFYSPLDNWIKLDLGITGRKFDGEASVTGTVTGIPGTTTATDSVDIDEWVPLLYLSARAELPLTGLYLDGSVNTIEHDGNRISDFTAAIGYAIDLTGSDLITELGYRNFSIEADDINDLEGNIDIDGLYFSIGLRF